MSSEVETSRQVSIRLCHGMESLASSRKLSGLRCSLDFARNDLYETSLGSKQPMRDRLNTREFRIDDYDGALQLWQRVEGVEVAEGDDREGVAQFVARNPGLSRVAIDGSAVVGVVMCGHDGRRGHIYHLAVDPAYRRYGLGRRLVKECLQGLRSAGVVRAIILVADYNLGGAEFWKRAGWEDITGAVPMGIDV